MALIHTCYRITDIDRSVAFYEALGFAEVGRLPWHCERYERKVGGSNPGASHRDLAGPGGAEIGQ